MNNAPVDGHEDDVGRKTSYHMTHAKAGRLGRYGPETVTVLFIGIPVKFQENVAEMRRLAIPQRSFDEYIYRTWYAPPGNTPAPGRYPSTGLKTIILALHLCRTVDIYGFGADRNGRWNHYYDPDRDKSPARNDIDAEAALISSWEKRGLIRAYRGNGDRIFP